MTSPHSLGSIYKEPGLIAAISLAGLLFALLGDGIWDVTSWLLLSLPIILLVFILSRAPGRNDG
jgi:hypothetical protein